MAAKTFRIFISSPSDVFAERERVERVIVRLNGELGGGLLEAIRWERSYYTAVKTFQDQIPLPSETDLVVCILWKRLGFELPPEYRRADGTTPTGTEYEFEDAMAAARAHGTPDVLVYRKAAPVLLDADQVDVERAQFEALKSFWSRWFRTETGHFTAAYQSFVTTDEFETEVEDHIRQWLARHDIAAAGVTWPIELRGSPFRGLQAFDAGHASVFFGRRRVVERARERLADAARRGTPFLLILGTSGAGKSSVARAGLQPRLTQPGAVPGVDLWRCCTMRPSEGETPLHALARALYQPGALPELAAGDNPAPADFAPPARQQPGCRRPRDPPGDGARQRGGGGAGGLRSPGRIPAAADRRPARGSADPRRRWRAHSAARWPPWWRPGWCGSWQPCAAICTRRSRPARR